MTTTELAAPAVYQKLYEQTATQRGADPSWLQTIREVGYADFAERGFPTLKEEDYRFTSFEQLEKTDFQLATARPELSAKDLAPYRYGDLETIQFVFVNGHFSPDLSETSLLPDDVIACSLNEAIEKHGEKLQERYNTQPDPGRNRRG